jgi:hypothetical protein
MPKQGEQDTNNKPPSHACAIAVAKLFTPKAPSAPSSFNLHHYHSIECKRSVSACGVLFFRFFLSFFLSFGVVFGGFFSDTFYFVLEHN